MAGGARHRKTTDGKARRMVEGRKAETKLEREGRVGSRNKTNKVGATGLVRWDK